MKALLPILVWFVLPHWLSLTAFLLSLGIFLLFHGAILTLKAVFAWLDGNHSESAAPNVIHVDFRRAHGARLR